MNIWVRLNASKLSEKERAVGSLLIYKDFHPKLRWYIGKTMCLKSAFCFSMNQDSEFFHVINNIYLFANSLQ